MSKEQHDQGKYLAALGAFRQAARVFAQAGHALGDAARAHDPSGDAPLHPLAEMTAKEAGAELRALCLQNPGFRELFRSAIGGI